jgi:acyl carrier protein
VHDRVPARVWVHRTLRTHAPGADIRTDSFTVTDEDGTVLVSVSDFMLRRMDTVRRTAPSTEARWLAPDEGVDAFLRSLRADVGAHVVITPTSLDWLMRKMADEATTAVGGPRTDEQPVTQAMSGEPTEVLVAGIWSSVLGVTTVAPESDFFELGGNSLVAVQLIAQIREATGVRLPMRAIFETPTVAEMAATITTMRAAQVQPAPPTGIKRLPREPA